MHRHSERGQGLIAGAVAMTLLVLTGVGIYMSRTDSEIEKDALRRTEEVANGPCGTRAQREAAEALPREATEMQRRDSARALNVIGVGGQEVGDTVELLNNCDEATNIYAEELYGRSPGPVQLERIRARASAAQRSMKKWGAPDGLQQNSTLITKMLRDSDRYLDYLGRGQNLDRERQRNPKWSKLSDDELRAKLLENQLSGPVLKAARGYRLVEQELKAVGLKATPDKVNAILKKAILADKGGSDDFDNALKEAVSAVAVLANLDGNYTGNYSGGSHGSCYVNITGTNVTIKLSGSGANKYGAFTADVSGSGTCSRDSGQFSGKLSGIVVNRKWGRYGCSGSFSGKAGNNSVSGNWSASSEDVPASGTFRASK